ncbi:hypothetical protein JW977_03280 [Candidatus Falkowbacteria bacterium]|nr:hypothetical protein [Candidatus Falkowbacteria bacterium]
MSLRQISVVIFFLAILASCDQGGGKLTLINDQSWPKHEGMGVVVEGPVNINGQIGVVRIRPNDAADCSTDNCTWGALVSMSENIKNGDHVEYQNVQWYNNTLVNYSLGRVARKVEVRGCNMKEGFYFTGSTWYEVTDLHQDRVGEIIKVQGVMWGIEAEGFDGIDPYLVFVESKVSDGKTEQIEAFMAPDNSDCGFRDNDLTKQKNLKLYMILYEDGQNFLQWAVIRE